MSRYPYSFNHKSRVTEIIQKIPDANRNRQKKGFKNIKRLCIHDKELETIQNLLGANVEV